MKIQNANRANTSVRMRDGKTYKGDDRGRFEVPDEVGRFMVQTPGWREVKRKKEKAPQKEETTKRSEPPPPPDPETQSDSEDEETGSGNVELPDESWDPDAIRLFCEEYEVDVDLEADPQTLLDAIAEQFEVTEE